MHTFHLAEGPGGFIEAICNRRNNPEDEYYGMTIIFDETDDNVPAWHKTGHFLSQHPNVTIEYAYFLPVEIFRKIEPAICGN